MEQPSIGGDRVAFLDHDDVAGHDIGRRDVLPFAVTDGVGMGGGHLAEGGDRRGGARFLDIAENGVEKNDGKDRQGLVRQRGLALVDPEAGRDRRRDQE